MFLDLLLELRRHHFGSLVKATVARPNQGWVTDITYIPVADAFV